MQLGCWDILLEIGVGRGGVGCGTGKWWTGRGIKSGVKKKKDSRLKKKKIKKKENKENTQ